MGPEMEAAHRLAGADMVRQRTRRLDRDRPVAADDDGCLSGLEHRRHGAINAFACAVGIDLRHRYIATIDGESVEIDAEFEPVGEIFLRGNAKLARSVLAPGLADIALIERHADKGIARALRLERPGFKRHM